MHLISKLQQQDTILENSVQTRGGRAPITNVPVDGLVL